MQHGVHAGGCGGRRGAPAPARPQRGESTRPTDADSDTEKTPARSSYADAEKSVRDARSYIAAESRRRAEIRYGWTLVVVGVLAAIGLALAFAVAVDGVVAALGGCVGGAI